MIQPQAIPSYSHPRTTEKLLALIRDERFENKTVVDLGAGAGYFSWKLFEVLERQGLDPSTIITPCDLYPELFQFDKLQCQQCDFNDGLGFEPATVDLVVCMEVIEHIPNHNLGPLPGEHFGFGGAHSPGSAADEGNLMLQAHITPLPIDRFIPVGITDGYY